MPSYKMLQASFAGGEYSPTMASRTDLGVYQQSAKTLRNGVPHVQGGVSKRLGTKFVGEVRDSSRVVRLIPYTNSKSQSYILVINGGKMEFIKNGNFITSGGNNVNISVPWADDELSELTYAQAGSLLFFAHPNHAPSQLGRSSDTSWALTTVDFTNDARTGTRFENNFIAFTIVEAGDGHDVNDYYTISVSGGGNATVSGPFNNSGGNAPVGSMTAVAVNQDNIVAQTWTVTCIVKSESKEVWDVVGSSSGRPPVQWSAGDYPKAVSFHEQRLWYGGSNTRRQTVWASTAGDYTDFTVGPGANDGLNFTIASNKFDQIIHLESARQLLIFSYGAEFTLSGAVGGVSPTGVAIRRHTMHGAAEMKPIRIGQEMVFAQRDKKKLRAVSYDVTLDANVATDITVRADHITHEDGSQGIVDATFQQDPDFNAWFIRDDGVMLSCTRQVDQEVTAWAKHTTTNGLFEKVSAIPEGDTDAVYCCVKRTVNGLTYRYVEYFTPSNEVYHDSHLSGTASPATATWTGLDHLAGETVDAVGDGALFASQVVTEITPGNWGIVLPSAVSTISVGLPYTTTIEMLHPAVPMGDGTSDGRQLNIKKAIIKRHDSVGLYVNGREDSDLSFPIDLDGQAIAVTGDSSIGVSGWTPPNNLTIESPYSAKWHVLGVVLHLVVNE